MWIRKKEWRRLQETVADLARQVEDLQNETRFYSKYFSCRSSFAPLLKTVRLGQVVDLILYHLKLEIKAEPKQVLLTKKGK